MNPPATSCDGPSDPAAVVAAHDGWWPSPTISQQPSGQSSTVIVRLQPIAVDHRGRRTVGRAGPAVGRASPPARTMRSTCSPLRRLCCPVTATVPAGSVHRAGARRRLEGRTVERRGDRPGHPDRHRLAVDGDEVVAAPGVERDGSELATTLPTSLIAAGITTVSPKRRSRVVRSVDRGDLDRQRSGREPVGNVDRRHPVVVGCAERATSTAWSPWVNRTAVTSE